MKPHNPSEVEKEYPLELLTQIHDLLDDKFGNDYNWSDERDQQFSRELTALFRKALGVKSNKGGLESEFKTLRHHMVSLCDSLLTEYINRAKPSEFTSQYILQRDRLKRDFDDLCLKLTAETENLKSSEPMQTQARICPLCKDDHSEKRPCEPADISIADPDYWFKSSLQKTDKLTQAKARIDELMNKYEQLESRYGDALDNLRAAKEALEGLLKTGRECVNDYEHGDQGYYFWEAKAQELLLKLMTKTETVQPAKEGQ